MDPDFHSPRLDPAPFPQPVGGLRPLLHIVSSLPATFPHQLYICLRIQLCVCMAAPPPPPYFTDIGYVCGTEMKVLISM